MAHSHHLHREHQVAHRRVNHILKDEPAGAKKHASGGAFSRVTSKSAAEEHGAIAGKSAPKKYARGGKVIDGESTKGDIKKFAGRAKANSYASGGRITAGAATGVGREQKAKLYK